MRKRIIIIAAVVIVAVIATVVVMNMNKNETGNESEETGLEEFTGTDEEKLARELEDSIEYEQFEFEVNDVDDRYSDEEEQECASIFQDLIKQYGEIAFNIDENTVDYTASLQALYHEGEYFGDEDMLANVYKELYGINTTSSLVDVKLSSLKITDVGDESEMDAVGYFTVYMASDKIPEGDYCIPFSSVAIKSDDEWKLYSVSYNQIYNADGFEMLKDSVEGEIYAHGDLIEGFDFYDVDGYINDYALDVGDDATIYNGDIDHQ